MIVLPSQHKELLACMLWGDSVYQLCSKGLITCYKTPADWTAAVLYQFRIFDPEKRERFTKKKNRVANNIAPKNNDVFLNKLKQTNQQTRLGAQGGRCIVWIYQL